MVYLYSAVRGGERSRASAHSFDTSSAAAKLGGAPERTRHVIGDTQFQNTLPSQLQHTQSALNREIRSAVETLGKKVA